MEFRERFKTEPKEKGLRWSTWEELGRLQDTGMSELSLEGPVQNNQVKQGREKSIPEGRNSMVCGAQGGRTEEPQSDIVWGQIQGEAERTREGETREADRTGCDRWGQVKDFILQAVGSKMKGFLNRAVLFLEGK